MALGLLLLLYRLVWTLCLLYVMTLAAFCCCVADKADEITGGFTGSWTKAGVMFDQANGNTFLQLVSFCAWNPVSYVAVALLLLGTAIYVRDQKEETA